ncbi:MAG: hypothetical protein AB7F86_18130, partial [Bdellovibrionales bacterium]
WHLNIGNAFFGSLFGETKIKFGGTKNTVNATAALEVVGTGSASSSIIIPRADTASRPTTAQAGMMRFNTTNSKFEVHDGTTWSDIATGSVGDFMKDGSVAMTGQLSASTGSAAAPGITFAGDSNTGMFRPGAGDSLGFSTAGGERIRIDSSGNVGIGTGAPAEPLHISKNANAEATIRIENTTSGSSAGSTLELVTDSSNTSAVFRGSSGYSPSEYANRLVLLDGSGTVGGVTLVGHGTSAYLNFMTGGTPVERMRVDANGYVGIGTTSPQTKLHVEGDLSGSSGEIVRAKSTVSGTGSGLYSGGSFQTDLTAGAPSSNTQIAGVSGSVAYAGSANLNGANASFSGSYGLASIANTGNTLTSASGVKGYASKLGAGTVTNLHGGNFSTFQSAGTVTNAVGGQFGVYSGGGTLNNGYGIFIDTVAGTNRYSLYASDANAPSFFAGDVRVGTTSGAGKVSVLADSGATKGVVIRTPSVSPTANLLEIQNFGGTGVTAISGTGWVGIGNASPTAQLDVVGTASASVQVKTGSVVYGKSLFNSGAAFSSGGGALPTTASSIFIFNGTGLVTLNCVKPGVSGQIVKIYRPLADNDASGSGHMFRLNREAGLCVGGEKVYGTLLGLTGAATMDSDATVGFYLEMIYLTTTDGYADGWYMLEHRP